MEINQLMFVEYVVVLEKQVTLYLSVTPTYFPIGCDQNCFSTKVIDECNICGGPGKTGNVTTNNQQISNIPQ